MPPHTFSIKQAISHIHVQVSAVSIYFLAKKWCSWMWFSAPFKALHHYIKVTMWEETHGNCLFRACFSSSELASLSRSEDDCFLFLFSFFSFFLRSSLCAQCFKLVNCGQWGENQPICFRLNSSHLQFKPRQGSGKVLCESGECIIVAQHVTVRASIV